MTERDKLIQKQIDHLKDKSKDLAEDVLRKFIERKVHVGDTHYVFQRMLQALEGIMDTMVWDSDQIFELRKKKMLEFINKERRIKKNKPADDLDLERIARTEPVVKEMLDKILTEGMLFSNEPFVRKQMEEDTKLLLYMLTKQYIDGAGEWVSIKEGDVKRRLLKKKCSNKEWEDCDWQEIDNLYKNG